MLKNKIKVTSVAVHSDARGVLAKIFDYMSLEGKNIQDVYVTYFKPRVRRANHYHKKTTEWFFVIRGKALIKFRDVKTKEEHELKLSHEDMKILEVPPLVNHEITALGDEELIVIAFGNRPYTKEDTDTYLLE